MRYTKEATIKNLLDLAASHPHLSDILFSASRWIQEKETSYKLSPEAVYQLCAISMCLSDFMESAGQTEFGDITTKTKTLKEIIAAYPSNYPRYKKPESTARDCDRDISVNPAHAAPYGRSGEQSEPAESHGDKPREATFDLLVTLIDRLAPLGYSIKIEK